MVEINNLTTSSVEEEFLKRVAEIVLKGENKEKADLSIVLVGQGRMRKLNRKYRSKNRVTDVLAFGQNQKFHSVPKQSLVRSKKIKNQKFPILPKNELGLGEAVICLREVKKNAKKYNSTFEKELGRVLIHGILHLSGYDHEKSEVGAKKMAEREQYYLSQI